MSVKVLKAEIIYNLDHYAKVYPNRDQSILCLADVQGDYDSLYFDSNKELNLAFKLIKSAFKENQTEDTVIDLDDLHNTLCKEVTIDQDELKKMFDKGIDREFENGRYDPPEHAAEPEQDVPEEENEWPAEHQEPWPDPWPHLDVDGELDNVPEEHEEAMPEEEEILPDEEVMADPFNNPDVGQPLGDLAEQLGFAGDQILMANAEHENHIVGLEDQIREEVTDQLAQQLDLLLADNALIQEIRNIEVQLDAEDRRRDYRIDELITRNQMLEQQVNNLQDVVYSRVLADRER